MSNNHKDATINNIIDATSLVIKRIKGKEMMRKRLEKEKKWDEEMAEKEKQRKIKEDIEKKEKIENDLVGYLIGEFYNHVSLELLSNPKLTSFIIEKLDHKVNEKQLELINEIMNPKGYQVEKDEEKDRWYITLLLNEEKMKEYTAAE